MAAQSNARPLPWVMVSSFATVAVLFAASVMAGSTENVLLQTATRYGGMLSATTGVVFLGWLSQKVHRTRQNPFPMAWRHETPAGAFDGNTRNVVKTFVTMCLVCVLPWQVGVLLSCIMAQMVLYYSGMGGGRPGGGPDFPSIPIEAPASWSFVKAFHGGIKKISEAVAPHLLHDTRNAPYLVYIFWLATWTPCLFAYCLHTHMATSGDAGFSFAMCYGYHALRMGPYFKFFAHAATLIHKEGHANKSKKGLFKQPYGFVLNHIMEWFVAFFYGHVPENYRVGHVEVHHGEGNDHGDCTSTLHVDRTKAGQFLRYLGDFAEFWSGYAVVEYFTQRIRESDSPTEKEFSDRRRQAAGMMTFYGGILLLAYYAGPLFAFMYILEPHLETINYLAAINYTWHTFVDPDDISNEYVKSITILEGQYNVFNEDYHVEHHLRPGVHWSRVYNEYEKRKDEYQKNQATIFKDTMEFELFFVILFNDLDFLAEHFVDLSGKMTTEEKKIELARRMQPVPLKALEKAE